MITLIEIAVYAVIISGGSPLSCFGVDKDHVTCTNGLSAQVVTESTIAFSDGTSVKRNNGYPIFSNGTTSWMDSAGWVQFTSGIGVRRMTPDYFKFSNGLECKTRKPNLVDCSKAGRDVPGEILRHK